MGKLGHHIRRKSKPKQEMEADTIGYMPERFITGYFELVRLGLKIEPSAQQFDNESGQQKNKYRTPDGGLRDERALRFKAWVDRQLRAIGRDVQAYLNARDGIGNSPVNVPPELRREIARELEQRTELKCRGKECGKYISWQWTFCAWCGTKIVRTSEKDSGDGKNQ